MMNVKIIGEKEVLNRLSKLMTAINVDIPRALESSTKILRDGAISYLIGSLGGGRWGPWGKSSDSIRDKSKWQTNKISPTKIELKCISNHAAVVELGGFGGKGGGGTVTAYVQRRPPLKPFPIGKAQGHIEAYRYGFAIQQGYHYTTRAMNSKSIQDAMAEDIARILRGSISKVAI